ncbi:MAG: 3-hydroxybutyryl-CoA dehydrogenase [Desulfovibrio sp.]
MVQFTRIAVIGSGIMGHGIALVCAKGGYPVTLIDVSADALENAKGKLAQAMDQLIENDLAPAQSKDATLARISYNTDMAVGVKDADIVFEAVPERLHLKESVYADLERFCKPEAIFASNTSGISINTLAALTKRPERFVGTHFFMPAHIVPLVEVIQTKETLEDVSDSVMTLLAELGKTPVLVKKDIAGFIGNRLQHALAREAMSLVQKGVASAEDVDTVVRTSLAIRLLFTGPMEQRDFNGLDTHMSIAEYLYPDLEDSHTPLNILVDAVEAGNYGLKSGKGFFDWTDKDIAAVTAKKNQQLIQVLKLLAKA